MAAEVDPHHPRRRSLRGFGYFSRVGPAIVTGAADDDPSGIGTYSQVGAAFGFGFLWTAVVTLPLAAAVQEVSARIGLTTGGGLATALKRLLYDTAQVVNPIAIRALLELVGPDRVVYGSDFPFVAEPAVTLATSTLPGLVGAFTKDETKMRGIARENILRYLSRFNG